ncbi:unnamed protein product [Phytomonas sp. EM1]|nr:unnamed protein product [Phytomonas sp. EM1]|eukprot:CCW62186.1 unnamed protein product [Phytomonas sp. isolate EM1]
MCTSSSILQSAGLCLQVLRSLREDEWATFSRLAYVMEMIQTSASPSGESKSSSVGSPPALATTTRCSSTAVPRTKHYDPVCTPSPYCASNQHIEERRLHSSSLTTPSERSCQEIRTGSSSLPGEDCVLQNGKQTMFHAAQQLQAGTTISNNNVQFLTPEQHQELFANVLILCKVHGMLVQEIEDAVTQLTSLQWELEKENTDPLDRKTHIFDRKATPYLYDAHSVRSFAENRNQTTCTSSTCSRIEGRNEHGMTWQRGLQPSQESSYKLRTSNSDSSEENSENTSLLGKQNATPAYDEAFSPLFSARHTSDQNPMQPSERLDESKVAEIILALFTSDVLKLFIYEHVDYTLNYMHKALPRVLGLAEACQQGTNVSTNPRNPHTATLTTPTRNRKLSDCDELLRYAPFLKVLLHAFGPSGVPDDARVRSLSLFDKALSEGRFPNNLDKNSTTNNPPPESNYGIVLASKPSVVIPKGWRGFETLLRLLAAPLPSLRRIVYAACCLLHSGALHGTNQELLQQQLLDILPHMNGENNMVLDVLAQQDVHNVEAKFESHSWMSIRAMDWFHSRRQRETSSRDANRIQMDPFHARSSKYILLHKSRLYKSTSHSRHERVLLLFSDWACYAEELDSACLRLRGAMPLEMLCVIDVEDSPSQNIVNCFRLISPECKELTFITKTPEEKRYWVNVIQHAIQQLKQYAQSNTSHATNSDRHYYSNHANSTPPAATCRAPISTIPAFPMDRISDPSHAYPTMLPLSKKSRLSRQRYDDTQRQALRLQQSSPRPKEPIRTMPHPQEEAPPQPRPCTPTTATF